MSVCRCDETTTLARARQIVWTLLAYLLRPGDVEGAISGGVSEKPVIGKFNHGGRRHCDPSALARILQTSHEMLYMPLLMP
jgi:hypothetical protein